MNEQRKVIYQLRDQVLEGSDLSGQVAEYLATSVDNAVSTNCVGEYVEEWDVEGLLTEVNTIWPTTIEGEAITSSAGTDAVYDLLMSDATAYYAGREEELGADTLREIERQVMIGIIDQRWREHLREMDHLQEGIHLRGIGQKDPLTEWQREGFEMFEKLVANVGAEFVQYVMRVQVVVEEAKPAVERMTLSGPEDPSSATAAGPAAALAPSDNGAGGPAEEPEQLAPVVKSDMEKTGRNEPCPCGSGKKFKNCHGAA
jgi:preprotein translocase subunit SecA